MSINYQHHCDVLWFGHNFPPLLLPKMSAHYLCQLSEPALNLVAAFQAEIDAIDPALRTECDTKLKQYLRKEVLKMRDELRDGHYAFVEKRRVRLRQLLEREAIDYADFVRELGYAIIPTQP